MKLIVQARDGSTSLIAAIRRAQHAIDVVIFRFDLKPMERALATAITRGVRVRALIAHTNRRGEKHLRLLEQSLLAAGVTVTRTGEDFVRYHGKMMVIDRHTLWVCGFMDRPGYLEEPKLRDCHERPSRGSAGAHVVRSGQYPTAVRASPWTPGRQS